MGPRQPERERAVGRIGGLRFLQEGNALLEVAGIYQSPTQCRVAALGRPLDHEVMKRPRRFLFLSIGWPPLAEFPLDEAGGSLHRRGLLRRRRRPPHQIATLLVLESVQKQKPGRVLGDSWRIGSLQHRLAEEIAGFVDPQFVFGLSPAFEGRGRLRRRVDERE